MDVRQTFGVCEVVLGNNCITLLRQPEILAVKSVTSWIYTGLYSADFSLSFGKFFINHGLFELKRL